MKIETYITAPGGKELPAILRIPANAKGLVIFAHGSGSSRMSPRNQQVAGVLHEAGLATLLFDLLTPAESDDRTNVFDIRFLASRLVAATRWALKQEELKNLPIGYFGASTGAGAALWAAADLGKTISAVVSRGGRPDLAMPRLRDVEIPTLLLVGGFDGPVIDMNQTALKQLRAGEIIIVPEATHLFEEPGKLEEVSRHATHFFSQHLPGAKAKAA